MREQYYPNLGLALRGFGEDQISEATVAEVVQESPSSANISVVEPTADGEKWAEVAATYLPDSTIVKESAGFITDAKSDVAPAAESLLAKFNTLSVPSKVALLAVGWFAAKRLSSQYVWIAGGLLAYNELRNRGVVKQEGSETSTPVAGLG